MVRPNSGYSKRTFTTCGLGSENRQLHSRASTDFLQQPRLFRITAGGICNYRNADLDENHLLSDGPQFKVLFVTCAAYLLAFDAVLSTALAPHTLPRLDHTR
jgi:hypothetical protein